MHEKGVVKREYRFGIPDAQNQKIYFANVRWQMPRKKNPFCCNL